VWCLCNHKEGACILLNLKCTGWCLSFRTYVALVTVIPIECYILVFAFVSDSVTCLPYIG